MQLSLWSPPKRCTPVRPYCRLACTRREPSERNVKPGVAVRSKASCGLLERCLTLSGLADDAFTYGSKRQSMAWAVGARASAMRTPHAPARRSALCRPTGTPGRRLLAVTAIVAIVVVCARGRRGLVQQHADDLARLDMALGFAYRLLRGFLGFHHHDDLAHVCGEYARLAGRQQRR